LIPNITRGGRGYGLIKYLVSPKVGEILDGEELHVNPRMIAGAEGVKDEWGGYDLSPTYNPSAARELAAWLDEPRLSSGTSITTRARMAAPVAEQAQAPSRVEAHMWHCSLSLHPDEPAQSDRQWQAITEEFISDMGLQNCRWLAVRHGASPAGNDHVHVVVQLVDLDGKAANVHNDRPKAQETCRALERRHGLHQVEGREQQRGARTTTPRARAATEREFAEQLRDTPDTRREVLERAVRTAAQASVSEADFVRRLRADGYVMRPRFSAGRDDQVIGFSIAETPREDQEPVPYAAGKLAKDLSLPRLRGAHGWRADEPAGVSEWQRARDGEAPMAEPSSPREISDDAWDRAIEELRGLKAQARALGPDEVGDRAQIAGQAAGLCYGWARQEPQYAAALHRVGHTLALSAQIRAAAARAARPTPGPRSAAMLLAAATRPQNRTLYWLVLSQELSALGQALRDLHAAAGELEQARALGAALREHVVPMRERLSDEHAAADPAYAAERSRRRQEKTSSDLQEPVVSPTSVQRRPAPPRPAAPRRPRRGI
jgi:hypothetical protein